MTKKQLLPEVWELATLCPITVRAFDIGTDNKYDFVRKAFDEVALELKAKYVRECSFEHTGTVPMYRNGVQPSQWHTDWLERACDPYAGLRLGNYIGGNHTMLMVASNNPSFGTQFQTKDRRIVQGLTWTIYLVGAFAIHRMPTLEEMSYYHRVVFRYFIHLDK